MNTTRILRRRIAGLSAAALLSGGMSLAAFGLGGGIAQAEPGYHSEPQFGTWCPGKRLPGGFTAVNWDMAVCHDYLTVSRYIPDAEPTIKGLKTRDFPGSDWYLVAGEDNIPVNCEVFVPGRNDPRCALG
jgi:hypothetical protein